MYLVKGDIAGQSSNGMQSQGDRSIGLQEFSLTEQRMTHTAFDVTNPWNMFRCDLIRK